MYRRRRGSFVESEVKSIVLYGSGGRGFIVGAYVVVTQSWLHRLKSSVILSYRFVDGTAYRC